MDGGQFGSPSGAFTLSYDIAKYFTRVLCSLETPITKDARRWNIQGMLIRALGSRACESYASGVSLAARGLIADSKAVARCQLEAALVLSAIARTRKYAVAYIAEGELQRLKAVRKLDALGERGKRGIPRASLDALRAEVTAATKKMRSRPIGIEQYAKWAKLHGTYLTLYSTLGGGIHPGVREIERFVQSEPDAALTVLRFGPRDDGIDQVLMSLHEVALHIIRVICKNHAVDLDSDFNDLCLRANARAIALHKESQKVLKSGTNQGGTGAREIGHRSPRRSGRTKA